MKLVLPLILLVLLLLVQYRLWLSDGGYQENGILTRQLLSQQQENQTLLARNQLLAAEVADLKKGLAVIEELARSQLGLIKPDEVFYHIVETQ